MTTLAQPSIELAEWASVELLGLRLSAADRALLDGLVAIRRLDYTEATDRVRLTGCGWIGVVRLDSCTIRIVPTLIDGHHSLVSLLAYLGNFKLLKQLDRGGNFLEGGTDLFDLLALLLAIECDRVRHMGPLADYERQHDELTLLRGRLDVKAQAIRRFGRVDTLVCDFDERVTEVPENRWLVRALRAARRRVQASGVSDRVRRSLSAWEEVCLDDGAEPLPRPEFTRANAYYRSALSLAYLVVDGVTASDLLTAGRITGFSFMISMPRLFEEFVTRLIQSEVPVGCEVEPQSRDRSVLWDVDQDRSFKTVRPDILVSSQDGRARVPVDAKYKGYADISLKSADVYQGAVYALALARSRAAGQVPACLMFYPVPRGGQLRQRVQVRVSGTALAEVDALGIAVDDVLDKRAAPPSGAVEPAAWLGALKSLLA